MTSSIGAWAVYVSIYSDVQIFADKIFADDCWSMKTANIKIHELLKPTEQAVVVDMPIDKIQLSNSSPASAVPKDSMIIFTKTNS